MNWIIFGIQATPERLVAHLLAEDGSRRTVSLEASVLAVVGRASAPLWDGRAKPVVEGRAA